MNLVAQRKHALLLTTLTFAALTGCASAPDGVSTAPAGQADPTRVFGKSDDLESCQPAGTDGAPVLAREYAGPDGARLTLQDGYASLQLADGTTVEGYLQRDGTLGASYTIDVEEGMVCGSFRISLWGEEEGVLGDGSRVTLSWLRPDGSVVRECGAMLAGEGSYERVQTPTLRGTYEGPEGTALRIDEGYATVRLADGSTVEGPLSRDGTLGGAYTIDVEEGMVCGTYRISLWASEGTLGSGRHVDLTWLAPDGSVARSCGFMRAAEGGFERTSCDAAAPEETEEDGPAPIDGGFTRSALDPSTGLMRGAHPEKFAVQWNDDSGTEGTVYLTKHFATGEPEAESCGRVTRGEDYVSFQGDCGLAADYAESEAGSGVYMLHQLVYLDDTGVSRVNVDDEGMMIGAHPEKFAIVWNDESFTEGAVHLTKNFATGEPEAAACGTIHVDGDAVSFAGNCGLTSLYWRASADAAAPFEAYERIDL